MIEQLTLPKMRRRKPNPPTGDDLKRRGIERALLNERARWRKRTLLVVIALADERLYFTADDIQAAVAACGLGQPHTPNVWGGVVRTAMLAGVMTRTERWVKGSRPNQHGRMIPVYRRVEADE